MARSLGRDNQRQTAALPKTLTSSLIITLTLTISATLANLPTFVDGLIYEWNG